MSKVDELRNTFFEECSELLQEIEVGLTDIRDGRGTDDTVHAVFRAAHSVKGGAGIFGFETLVEFAHVFETVLDALRHGTLAASDEVLVVLLGASDILSDLVTMARSGKPVPPGYDNECRSALNRLIDANGDGAAASNGAGSEAAGDFDGIDFMPVRADDFGEAEASGERVFKIAFRPRAEMLKKANEPLYILRELAKLGSLELTADTGALPRLSELQPDNAYINWTGTLRTAKGRQKIEEVFEFVVDDCDLEIVEELPEGTAAPIAETALAESCDAIADSTPPVPPANPAANGSTKAAAEMPARPAEAADAPKDGAAAAAKPAAMTTRVDLEKIDRVVNMVGELVIAQAMLGQVVRELPEKMTSRLQHCLDEVIHHTRELKDSVMSMRAQQVRTVFQRMPRLVRELSAKTSKNVRLEMSGEATEIDKTIIERLSDPLTHIIRNSVDHGIESPQDRRAAGKSEQGVIHLSAGHRGGRIVIEVSDDGAGINGERVLKKAKERGLIDANAALTEDEISNLVFLPGFSTAETVSDISGRGVGMDVVRRNIMDIGGRITLKSEPGRGTTIQLSLPLTLAVMDGMVVEIGQDNYVVPISAIVECMRPTRADVRNLLGTAGTLQLRGAIVPLVHLGDLFGIRGAVRDVVDGVVIIVEAGEGARLGIVVDELRGHQQVVIKSIEENYGVVPGIAGATILGNGRVAFILDVDRLSNVAGAEMENAALPRAEPAIMARPS
ncbi:MAG: chemotaxis protein CheA [Bradyrhizobiaceae bacterium]|nr:chemotaxis protein CheA [Bradyrhizobiaceae bacterium]